MSCLDGRTSNFRQADELMRVVKSHNWELVHFDDLDSGIIMRYACTKCKREWTTFLIDPEKTKLLKQ